jgi:DNA-binding MarR family transcriptional regulator
MKTVGAGTPYTALTGRTSFLANKIGILLIQAAESRLAELRLNARTYFILTMVGAPNSPSQIDLARMLSLNPTLVVSHIDDLQAVGLVERTRSTRDRRRYELRLTPAGVATLRRADEAVAEIEADFFAPLTERQLSQFHRMLQLLVKDRWPPQPA